MNINKIIPMYNFVVQKEVAISNELEGLSERQKMVYLELKNHTNGATAKELSVKLYNEGKVMSNERNSVHPRLNELIHIGLVISVGKKTCQYTDKKVTIYKTK